MTPEAIHNLIAEHLPNPSAVPMEVDTELRDLGADDATIEAVALEVGYLRDRDVSDAEARSWVTVGDVQRALERAEL